MRKEFITPSINVKSFSREVILTASVTNAELAKDALNADLNDKALVSIETVDITW